MLGYLAVNKGFNPFIACLCSGAAGLILGRVAVNREWSDYIERKSRRDNIQYELDCSWQNNDDHQQMSDLYPEAESNQKIAGKTFELLQRGVAAFPARYPEYSSKPPKLDVDIRPWLKEAFNASDREAHVFGAIIAEHFKLLGDTPKAK